MPTVSLTSFPTSRYLIVNGDDFGLSAQVNAGILYAHRNGILTNTSLMVAAPAWEEAVEIARSTASLGVGLHLTLLQGKAALPPRLLPSLTDSAGNFSHNPTLSGLRYFFSKRARNEVRAECRAQIERFLETGLPLSHVDGHVNIHMHPVVLDTLLGLSEEYRIPAIRLTREDVVCSLGLDSSQALRKRWEAFIFSNLARGAEKKLNQAGIRYPDYLYGLHQSGGLDERYLRGLLPQLRYGVTELYCHPSFLPCPEVRRWTPTYRRDAELDALTSAAVRDAIATQAIQLVNYHDLSTLET